MELHNGTIVAYSCDGSSKSDECTGTTFCINLPVKPQSLGSPSWTCGKPMSGKLRRSHVHMSPSYLNHTSVQLYSMSAKTEIQGLGLGLGGRDSVSVGQRSSLSGLIDGEVRGRSVDLNILKGKHPSGADEKAMEEIEFKEKEKPLTRNPSSFNSLTNLVAKNAVFVSSESSFLIPESFNGIDTDLSRISEESSPVPCDAKSSFANGDRRSTYCRAFSALEMSSSRSNGFAPVNQGDPRSLSRAKSTEVSLRRQGSTRSSMRNLGSPSLSARNLRSRDSSTTPGLQKGDSVWNGLRVLLVDDSPMNRKMLHRILVRRLDNIFEAIDGLDAYHQVAASMSNQDEKIFDVVLMDFQMPNLNGAESTRRMRDSGYKGVIIGVTGNSLPEDIALFLREGADSVIIKPVDIGLLQEILFGRCTCFYMLLFCYCVF